MKLKNQESFVNKKNKHIFYIDLKIVLLVNI